MNKKILGLITVFVLSGSLQVTATETKTAVVETETASGTEQQAQYSWLGVMIQPLPMPLAKHFSGTLKENQGVMVRSVHSSSAAEKSGVQPFDIISGLNDQEIYTTDQFSHLIRSSRPGTVVKLHLIRQGQQKTLDVTLQAQPAPKKTPPRAYMPHAPFPYQPDFDNMRPPRGFNNMMPPRDWSNKVPSMHHDFRRPVPQIHSWSEFESLQVESVAPDKYKASVKYEDSEGNKQSFTFEGKMNEIHDQIITHKTLPDDKKRSLLQALDMNMAPPVYGPRQAMPDPEWFRQNQLPVPPWYR